MAAKMWHYGKLAFPGLCFRCALPLQKGEWGYNDPQRRLHCTRCAAELDATTEKSPEAKAKLQRIKGRLFDFLAGEIERKLKG